MILLCPAKQGREWDRGTQERVSLLCALPIWRADREPAPNVGSWKYGGGGTSQIFLPTEWDWPGNGRVTKATYKGLGEKERRFRYRNALPVDAERNKSEGSVN